jgi:hypothetical protein
MPASITDLVTAIQNGVTAANNLNALLTNATLNSSSLRVTFSSSLVFPTSPITNSLAADIPLNNTAQYFHGPVVTQGSSGTWFVSGTVTLRDTAGAANFNCVLWDGTNVIASGAVYAPVAGANAVVALSGYIVSPTGNLKISVQDVTSVSGLIKYNISANAHDSTITAYRIA